MIIVIKALITLWCLSAVGAVLWSLYFWYLRRKIDRDIKSGKAYVEAQGNTLVIKWRTQGGPKGSSE